MANPPPLRKVNSARHYKAGNPVFWDVTVKQLAQYGNPYTQAPWLEFGGAALQRLDIELCLLCETFETERFERVLRTGEVDRGWHHRRIAYLVRYADRFPVCVEVPIPSLGCWPEQVLNDGWHRLAAALYRGDSYIAVSYGGDEEEFFRLFPCAKPSKLFPYAPGSGIYTPD